MPLTMPLKGGSTRNVACAVNRKISAQNIAGPLKQQNQPRNYKNNYRKKHPPGAR